MSDDRHFLFYRVDLRNAPESPLAIGSLDSLQVKGLSPSVQVVQSAHFVPPDQLLVVGQRTLFAQHLDTVALELAGARAVVTEQVADFRATATPGYAAVSVSKTGSVAYRAKDTSSSQLYWYDRQGKQIGPLAQPAESATIAPPRLSPDGRTVAVVTARSDGAYVRLIDTKNGSTRNIFVCRRRTIPLGHTGLVAGRRIPVHRDDCSWIWQYRCIPPHDKQQRAGTIH